MIYLDNAATTLRKPPQVIDAVARAMGSFGNSARGTHEGALTASRTIYNTRCKLAALFGCPRPDHVVFTANSTEALNIAINGLVRPGDHVLSTDLEHNSVLRPLYRLRDERGVALDFVPADRQGRIDYADLERLLRPETRAIVCTHASNLTGDAVDLARVGELAHAHGVLLVVDASQSAGVLPIDMERMHIDVLCFTGHKSLMGPQGTGGLCLRGDPDILPWKVGGGRGHPSLVRRRDGRADLLRAPARAAARAARGGNAQRPRHRRTGRGAGLHRGDRHGDHPRARDGAHAPLL